MAGPLILLGTGTSVGKTYVAERLLRALGANGRRAYGYKPVESGVSQAVVSDAERLVRASAFHVKPTPVRLAFAQPVSPHLAARATGQEINLASIRRTIHSLLRDVDPLLVELPGGAFSPLTESEIVAHFVLTIPDAAVLLVAPDRIGVLHDLGAATRAAAAIGLPIHAIVLSAPEVPDESTGANADEIRLISKVPYLATFPREPADARVPSDHPAYRVIRALNL